MIASATTIMLEKAPPPLKRAPPPPTMSEEPRLKFQRENEVLQRQAQQQARHRVPEEAQQSPTRVATVTTCWSGRRVHGK
eukprot:5125693-Amphidinium_carterae.1